MPSVNFFFFFPIFLEIVREMLIFCISLSVHSESLFLFWCELVLSTLIFIYIHDNSGLSGPRNRWIEHGSVKCVSN